MQSGILDYYRTIASYSNDSRYQVQISLIEYLKEISHLSGELRELSVVGVEDLNLFRRVIMSRPEDLRRRLLGSNLLRLRSLTREQRSALRVFEVLPDLLSPLGELRYEPAHSRLIGYFLERKYMPDLSRDLLGALLAMLGAPPEVLDEEILERTSVSTEVVIESGRVDLHIDNSEMLAFIEVKVDASQGESQLERYRAALDARGGSRVKLLGFLTLPEAAAPPEGLICNHATFADLLSCWLPFAQLHNDHAAFLARYLCSVAQLLGYVGRGPFEYWTFADQRNALDYVSQFNLGGSLVKDN